MKVITSVRAGELRFTFALASGEARTRITTEQENRVVYAAGCDVLTEALQHAWRVTIDSVQGTIRIDGVENDASDLYERTAVLIKVARRYSDNAGRKE